MRVLNRGLFVIVWYHNPGSLELDTRQTDTDRQKQEEAAAQEIKGDGTVVGQACVGCWRSAPQRAYRPHRRRGGH